MNDSAWERLIDAVDATCGIDKHSKNMRPLDDRPDLNETVEVFEFERGGQAYKLERVSGPAIIDRKTHFTHRAGTANRIENIYDEHELGHKVTLYKNEAGDWQPQDMSALSL
ncbi:MAG TPA: hypothetical protein VLF21_00645 [Candidatus Saccharimonadales bacterium]|nr:hypothetical protein [Candidatus Saccharimonadales bacterium]